MKRKESDPDKEDRSSKDRGRDAEQESTSPTAGSGAVSSLHRTVGNQAVRRLYEKGEIQAKLAVSQPDDPAEREADRIAERVMRTSTSDQTVDSGLAPEVRRTKSGSTVRGETMRSSFSTANLGRIQ